MPNKWQLPPDQRQAFPMKQTFSEPSASLLTENSCKALDRVEHTHHRPRASTSMKIVGGKCDIFVDAEFASQEMIDANMADSNLETAKRDELDAAHRLTVSK